MQTWVNKIPFQWFDLYRGSKPQVKLIFAIHPETLRRIDLTRNLISEIEEGAFSKLPNLEELILAENRLSKLPMLPTKLVMLNVNFNKLRTQGVKANAFKVSSSQSDFTKNLQTFFATQQIIPIYGLFFYFRNLQDWHTYTWETMSWPQCPYCPSLFMLCTYMWA